ncbi:MAG: hypothetical protein PWQ54_10 [Bacteroidales bacterium]|jgi:CubicO group peptidase (beta-lactamase class C family)|nr:hypothetical protein [Bacteroidales bacterium]
MNSFYRLLVISVFFLSLTSCHVGRFFYYNFADIKDYKKFPNQVINCDTTTYRKLPVQDEIAQKQLIQSFGEVEGLPFAKFLEEHKTVAFIILQGDRMIYEAYFNGYDATAVIPVFSVSKSYVSALVGIALEKGYFKSIEDSVTLYIPELQGKGLEKISLKNLLEMRSGLDYQENYASPFADMAKYYYGKNLRKYVTKLKTAEAPGERYEYQSVNTLLLGLALEQATGQNPAILLQNWIWKKAGMQYDASWSFDSRKHQTIKAFCCINLRATDLARFGLLYKDGGKWQENAVIPESWIRKSLEITNNSRDSGGYPYTMHWRSLTNGSFFAKGVLGQYLFVDPENDLVIVRLGKAVDGINWVEFFREISKQLE